MQNDPATFFQRIKERLSKVSGPDTKGWYKALCPFHNDQNNPNLYFKETGFKCFACGIKGSLYLLAEKLGIEVPASSSGLTLAELANSKGVPQAFLSSLGVSDGVSGAGRYRRPCVDIPFMDEKGSILAVQKRLSLHDEPRFIWRRGDHPILYGLWKIGDFVSSGYILIVEGPSDVWTCWYHGIPALGMPGASTWKQEYAELLNGLDVYVWIEPDQGGDTLLKAVSDSLPEVKVIKAPQSSKDPSALYLIDKEHFQESLNKLISEARSFNEISRESLSREAQGLANQITNLLHEPLIFERLKQAIRASGYAGDLRPALIVFVAITSRLLGRPINLFILAASGSGKNASIEFVLSFFPEDAYYIVRASSPLALVYSEEDFKNRTVIIWEADSLPEDGPAASAIRSLMSDQRLEYQVVERDESGHQTVRLISKEGPTGLITTSTKHLQEQASTRMLTVTISDSPEQTRAVLKAIANKESSGNSIQDFSEWVSFQKWLAIAGKKEVFIPYASKLAELIPADAIRVRRDFSQVLAVIKVFAIIHQEQRENDASGRIIASLEDYELTRWLLEETFSTSITGGITPAVRETVQSVIELYLPDSPVSLSQLAEKLGLSKSTISYRVNRALDGGWLVNRSNRRGASAQLEPGLPMPDNNQLPTAEAFVCVVPPENHSNTRTLLENPGFSKLNENQKVYESAFEHFQPFEHSKPFEQSFEHFETPQSEAKNTDFEESVRMDTPKTEEVIHTHKQSVLEGGYWEEEL